MCVHHSPSVQDRTLGRRGFLKGIGIVTLGVTGAGAVAVQSAQAATVSQNGWPASPSLALNTNFNVGGTKFPQGVAPGAPSTILGYVATQFAAKVEPLVTPGCWGFNYREVTGGGSLSNHSSGTAIDVNAPAHPYGAANTFSAAQVSAIRAILAACEGTVRWGGDYSSNKDEMHFELNKGPNDPLIASVAAKLGGGTTPPTSRPTLKEGSTGAAVVDAQNLLRQKGYDVVADGDFGAKTKAAVIAFQKSKGLSADGIIGPQTWAALEA